MGGFSVGARFASLIALNLPKPCGGLILCSGLPPFERKKWKPRQFDSGIKDKTHVLYMFGDCDDILDPEGKYKGRFRRSVKMLKENGFEVKDVEYPQVGH